MTVKLGGFYMRIRALLVACLVVAASILTALPAQAARDLGAPTECGHSPRA